MEAVAAQISVPDDGGIEAVTQVCDVTLDGCAGDFQFLDKPTQGDSPVVFQEAFDLVNTLEGAHQDHANGSGRERDARNISGRVI